MEDKTKELQTMCDRIMESDRQCKEGLVSEVESNNYIITQLHTMLQRMLDEPNLGPEDETA